MIVFIINFIKNSTSRLCCNWRGKFGEGRGVWGAGDDTLFINFCGIHFEENVTSKNLSDNTPY